MDGELFVIDRWNPIITFRKISPIEGVNPMATMRAAQITEPGKDFEIVEREIPEPGEGQVRIKVEACGICHSDDVVQSGEWPYGIDYPRVPGHEVIGHIDKVGRGVDAWKEGQRVGVGWQGNYCSKCGPCRSGDFANCVWPDITGLTYDGGFAEYMIAFEKGLAGVPEDMPGIQAGPLMCAGLTTFIIHSATRGRGLESSSPCSVWEGSDTSRYSTRKKWGSRPSPLRGERIARSLR